MHLPIFLPLLFLFCLSTYSLSFTKVYSGYPQTVTNVDASSGFSWTLGNSLDDPSTYVDVNLEPEGCEHSDYLTMKNVNWSLPTVGVPKKITVRILKYVSTLGTENAQAFDFDTSLFTGTSSVCSTNKAKLYSTDGYWLKNGYIFPVEYTYTWNLPADCSLGLSFLGTDTEFGVRFAAQVQRTEVASPPNSCSWSGNWGTRNCRVSSVFLDIELEHSNIDISSISPNSSQNSAAAGTITVTGTNFVDTGSIKCRYYRQQTGRNIFQDGTYVDETTVTCPVPSLGPSDYEVGELELSFDGGITYTTNQKTFTWEHWCPDGLFCGGAGTCNVTTGVCMCNTGLHGDTCGVDCTTVSTTPGPTACTACLAAHPACAYCIGTLSCGFACADSNDTFSLEHTGGFCPTITGLGGGKNLIDPKGGNISLVGYALPQNSSVNCTFGHLGSAAAIPYNSTAISCISPKWVPDTNGTKNIFTRASNDEIEGSVSINLVYGNVTINKFPFVASYGVSIPVEENVLTTKKTDKSSEYATIGSLSTIGSIIFCLCVFAYIRYRRKLAADKFRSLFEVPMFSLGSAYDVAYFHGGSESRYVSKTSEKFWYLQELCSDPRFVQCVAATFDTHESDDLSKALIYLAEVNGEALQTVRHFMALEYNTAPNGVQLFRGYNTASKLWTGYCKLDCVLEYIHTCLARDLYDVCSEFGYDDFHLEAERAQEINQSVSVNKYRLMGACQKILDTILQSAEIVPINIRLLMHFVKSETSKKFPDYIHRTLGNFMFLRLFCPAIAAPEVYGLLKEEPDDASRNLLILVARVMQNLANGVLFGTKQEAMCQLNDFLRTNFQVLKDWFDQVATCDEDDIAAAQNIPEDVKNISLILLYNYVHGNLEKIQGEIKKVYAADPDDAQSRCEQIAAVVTAIGEPHELEFEDDGLD